MIPFFENNAGKTALVPQLTGSASPMDAMDVCGQRLMNHYILTSNADCLIVGSLSRGDDDKRNITDSVRAVRQVQVCESAAENVIL
jgi:hypothetical protein